MSLRAMTWAWEQDVNNAGALLVLLALADHADDEGICWPGHKGLERKCRMARATVIRHINALAKVGLVEVERRHDSNGHRETNRYRLSVDPPLEHESSSRQTLSDDNGRGSKVSNCKAKVSNSTGQGLTARQESVTESVTEPVRGVSPPTPPSASQEDNPDDGLLARFPEFQQAYPPRRGSQEWPRARRAWEARMREGVEPAALIAAAERYRQHCQAEGKIGTPYVKMAATFLGPDQHWQSVHELPVTNRAEDRDSRNASVVDRFINGPGHGSY